MINNTKAITKGVMAAPVFFSQLNVPFFRFQKMASTIIMKVANHNKKAIPPIFMTVSLIILIPIDPPLNYLVLLIDPINLF